MMWDRRQTGTRGERVAEKFLRAEGFVILERNYRTPFGEIDIVARQKDTIVFVEVRTHTNERFGDVLESITPAKQRHIIKNSLYYLKRYRLFDKPCRIDVIGVDLDEWGNDEKIKYVRNAVGT